jgi:alginate O-acetyltransferase complex protein AlgJ
VKKPRKGAAHCLLSALLIIPLIIQASVGVAQAADAPSSIIGKNDWLYYRYELSSGEDTANADASIDLIVRLNRVLARNGVTLAVALVPIKMRIHSENLPTDLPLSPYLSANYERIAAALRASQVHFLDLNSAFLNSPKRTGDMPLFIRQDTHWSPSGALLGAEAIRARINADPTLKKLLDAVPAEKFNLTWGQRPIVSKSRDLFEQLPKGSPSLAPEHLLTFSVMRAQAPKEDLLSDSAGPAVALLGSSYSDVWTGFPAALRYTLQRDILDISVGADRGSWHGIETYLRDEAFQTQKPKLLIWELPERDIKALPDYQYRDARYRSDNIEWLLRAASWVEVNCSASPVKAKFEASGIGTIKGASVSTGLTKSEQFIDISFSEPLGRLDYVSAELTSNGARAIILEASGAGVATRRFDMMSADDGAAHAFKTPLPSVGAGAGFSKLRIFPGNAKSFALGDLKVCRHPDGLLK